MTKGLIFAMLKLILRILKLILICFIGITVLWVIFYRFVNPPVTWLMIARGFERKADGKDWKIDKHWVGFEDIAEHQQKLAHRHQIEHLWMHRDENRRRRGQRRQCEIAKLRRTVDDDDIEPVIY